MLNDYQKFQTGVVESALKDLKDYDETPTNYEDFSCVITCCDRIINACKEIQRNVNNRQIVSLLTTKNPFE